MEQPRIAPTTHNGRSAYLAIVPRAWGSNDRAVFPTAAAAQAWINVRRAEQRGRS